MVFSTEGDKIFHKWVDYYKNQGMDDFESKIRGIQHIIKDDNLFLQLKNHAEILFFQHNQLPLYQ
jgi:chromosomal replication initiation ATPase DnaA